jgi:hypothetical protein
VLDGVKTGAFGEHPAGEDTMHLARERGFVDLDKGCGARRLGRRAGIADPRRHFERAELDRLVHGDFQMVDAPRDLVQSGEHRDLIPNDLGMGRARGKHKGEP